MIRAVVFDMDGTVLNTLPALTYFVNRAMDHVGRPRVTEDQVRYFAGNGAKLLIERALEATGGWDTETYLCAYTYYMNEYDGSPAAKTSPYPGIPELLSALRREGVKTAVITNKPQTAAMPLVDRFFPDLFDFVWGEREGMPLKPDPMLGQITTDYLGVSADETVYVGDSAVDMKMGHAMRAALTVGVLWGFREEEELVKNGADRIVRKPEEILDIVKNN